MDKIKMNNYKAQNYDVIIIGSGMGGLGAGLIFQQNKINTLIVEKHDRPGGFVTGFTRKGHYFDGGAEGIIYAGENQPLSNVLKKLEVEQEFILIDTLEKMVYPDKEINLYSDYDKFKSELIQKYPPAEDEINNYFEIMKKMTNQFWRGDPTVHERNWWSMLKFLIRSPTIVRYGLMSFENFLDKKLPNKELRSILSFYNLWLGAPSSEIIAPTGVIVGGNPFIYGNYYPKGGMLEFSKNLAHAFEQKGGTIIYNTEITKIIVEDKKGKGVQSSTGEEFKAKLILSNADLLHTYTKLLGNSIEEEKLKKVKSIKPSISGFGVFLITDLTLEDYPSHITIRDSYDCPITPILKKKFEMDGLAIRIPSKIDPSLKRDDGTAIIVLALAPYDWKAQWKTNNKERKEKYKELKRVCMNKIIKKIEERLIHDFSKHIIYKEAATPLTFERYTFAAKGGWYGPHENEPKEKFRYAFDNVILVGSNVGSKGVPTSFIDGVHIAEKIIKNKSNYI